MKYEELSDKDKVRLILQHVIPHEIADDIVFNGRHIVIERRWTKDNPVKPIDWPVAAWDDAAEVWWTRDIASNWDTAFNPLHDLNDTWLIMDEIKPGRHLDHHDILSLLYVNSNPDTFLPHSLFIELLEKTMTGWWSYTKERFCQEICKNALKDYDVLDAKGNVIEASE